MKNVFMVVVGTLGGILSHFFGAWDKLIEAMIVFMVIDIITGVIVAMFKNSDKSHDGKLWSVAMWRGMAKKGMALLFVIIGCQFDYVLETDYVRTAVIWCILASESLSIFENFALMGIPIPQVLKNMLSVIGDKAATNVTDKMASDITENIIGKDDKGDKT